MKNKPVPNDFYLDLVIDENLYLNAHIDFVCTPLVKYFGIFNHIKSFITTRIARQLYFAFINFCINHGTWVNCKLYKTNF